mgnify:FL=1
MKNNESKYKQVVNFVIDGIAVATAKANGGTKPLNRKNRTRLRRTVGYVMQHPERQLFCF